MWTKLRILREKKSQYFKNNAVIFYALQVIRQRYYSVKSFKEISRQVITFKSFRNVLPDWFETIRIDAYLAQCEIFDTFTLFYLFKIRYLFVCLFIFVFLLLYMYNLPMHSFVHFYSVIVYNLAPAMNIALDAEHGIKN